jgi:hypothetical protein
MKKREREMKTMPAWTKGVDGRVYWFRMKAHRLFERNRWAFHLFREVSVNRLDRILAAPRRRVVRLRQSRLCRSLILFSLFVHPAGLHPSYLDMSSRDRLGGGLVAHRYSVNLATLH